MKAYQLIFVSHAEHESHPGKLYSSKTAAEAAQAWFKSLPQTPVDLLDVEIQEVEIEDVFVPWISEEKIKVMRKEADEYWAGMNNHCYDDEY